MPTIKEQLTEQARQIADLQQQLAELRGHILAFRAITGYAANTRPAGLRHLRAVDGGQQ